MMKILILTLAFIGIMSLSACETVKGFGRDLHNGGKAVDEMLSG